jgi:hypothetical protein
MSGIGLLNLTIKRPGQEVIALLFSAHAADCVSALPGVKADEPGYLERLSQVLLRRTALRTASAAF